LPELNVKHINKIIRHIKGDLRRLWMPFWWAYQKGAIEGPETYAPCNTAACFAGWSLLLSMPRKDWAKHFDKDGELKNRPYDYDYDNTEGRRLGLTTEEAWMLFDGDAGDTRRQQWATVKGRLKEIIKDRVARGELSAKKIRL
jgi:hypothetical protein